MKLVWKKKNKGESAYVPAPEEKRRRSSDRRREEPFLGGKLAREESLFHFVL